MADNLRIVKLCQCRIKRYAHQTANGVSGWKRLFFSKSDGTAGTSLPKNECQRLLLPFFCSRRSGNLYLRPVGRRWDSPPKKEGPFFGALLSVLYLPQHFLYFLPEPQGHGSLRPGFASASTVRPVFSHTRAPGVSAQTFRLGCTPIINLFEQTAEPIPLTQFRYEYHITPDVAHPGYLLTVIGHASLAPRTCGPR